MQLLLHLFTHILTYVLTYITYMHTSVPAFTVFVSTFANIYAEQT
jgi:hypothetical protein